MYNFSSLRLAARKLSRLNATTRSAALLSFATLLENNSDEILEASIADHGEHHSTMRPADAARLLLSREKIGTVIQGIRQIASLSDPVDQLQARTELDDNLILDRIAVPIGVFGIIFESRADVAPQILGLALRSGNAVILKGGKETQRINSLYASLAEKVQTMIPELPEGWFQLHHERGVVDAMLTASDDIDLIIPRGSNELVRSIKERSLIPVLSHADGVCHLYVHSSADISQALALIFDSKTQYPAACNALETVIIDQRIANQILPQLVAIANEQQVELRGCQEFLKYAPLAHEVSGSQWHTEYGESILAVKVVLDLDEAVKHINTYGSHHTDAIAASDTQAIETFLAQTDSASVFANCSTRFADGFRYGLGAEIGISTGRIHARGPVGIEGLMTYKYLLRGNGNLVASYAGEQGRKFSHRKKLLE